jgi:two-component system, chemotaxis family, chemotaxis protein CheY
VNSNSPKVCMIVDDSKAIRRVISGMLSKLNYNVVEAEDGSAALDQYRNKHPDIILLDWNMPGMDGLECLKQLRAMHEESRPIVVMCTTENTMPKIVAAMGEGADEYIMKPFDIDILKSKLEQLGLVGETPQ